MSDDRLHMTVGLVLMPIIAAGVVAVLIIGDRPLRPTVDFVVEFDYVGQLAPGAKVKMANMEIGRVKHIGFYERTVNGKTVRRVRAYVWIYKRHQRQVYTNSKAFIASASLIGTRHLELAAPDAAPGPPIQAGDVLQGKSASYLDRFLWMSYENLVVAQDLADAVAPHWRRLTTQLDLAERNLRELRRHQGRLRETVRRVDQVARSARASYHTLRTSTDGFQSPERLGASYSHLARRTRAAVAPLASDVARLASLLDAMALQYRQRLTPAMASLRKRARRVSQRFAQIERWLRVVGQYLERGRGTVGAFMKDRELWDDFKASGKIIRQKVWLNIARPRKTSVKGNPALP